MYNAGKESNIQDHGEGLSLRQTVRQAFIYGLWKLTFQHTFYLLVVVTFDYVKPNAIPMYSTHLASIFSAFYENCNWWFKSIEFISACFGIWF